VGNMSMSDVLAIRRTVTRFGPAVACYGWILPNNVILGVDTVQLWATINKKRNSKLVVPRHRKQGALFSV
jgi:hypothetical protein